MLKELNSIFAGLLGLQGYPVPPPVAPSRPSEDPRARVPAARPRVRPMRAGAGRLARSPVWLGVRR